MRTQLDGLERHGELVEGAARYDAGVRAELLAMSAASTGTSSPPRRPANATTPSEERAALNRPWKVVNDRFNYLTPTKNGSTT